MKQPMILLLLICAIILIIFGCTNDGPTTPSNITINGYVYDKYGQPVQYAKILILGKNPDITDETGAFSIQNVTPPYTITALINSTPKTAITYIGLNRPDPKLLYQDPSVQSYPNTASIKGSVPIKSGMLTRVFFISGDNSWAVNANGVGDYEINLGWFGSISILEGKLYLIRYNLISGTLQPMSYDGYAEKTTTISSPSVYGGMNFDEVDIMNPAEETISGTVSYPVGLNPTERLMGIMFGNSIILLGGESNPSGIPDNFTYNVPSIPDVKFGISASAAYHTIINFKYFINVGSNDVNISLESPPVLLMPLNSTTNVDITTQFAWTQDGGSGINLVRVNSADGPTYIVYTTATNVTIPDLILLGLELPPSKAYTWNVTRCYPVSSIDNAASETFAQIIRLKKKIDFGMSMSSTFNFTTKP